MQEQRERIPVFNDWEAARQVVSTLDGQTGAAQNPAAVPELTSRINAIAPAKPAPGFLCRATVEASYSVTRDMHFLTQAKNPTRYSYLAPGMMAAREEQETLTALEHRPPDWILYLPLTRDEFLRIFPNATGLDSRFTKIEQWIEGNYAPTGVAVGGYQLRQRRQLANRETLHRTSMEGFAVGSAN